MHYKTTSRAESGGKNELKIRVKRVVARQSALNGDGKISSGFMASKSNLKWKLYALWVFFLKSFHFSGLPASCTHNTLLSVFPHNKTKCRKEENERTKNLRPRISKADWQKRANVEGTRSRRTGKIKDFEVFGASAAHFVQFICTNRSSLLLACYYFFAVFFLAAFFHLAILRHFGKLLSNFFPSLCYFCEQSWRFKF